MDYNTVNTLYAGQVHTNRFHISVVPVSGKHPVLSRSPRIFTVRDLLKYSRHTFAVVGMDKVKDRAVLLFSICIPQ